VVSSSRVLAHLQLRLLDNLTLGIVLLSVLISRSLLRALPALGTLLGRFLRSGSAALAICLLGSSVTALLATVESS
jgi:hypothetical protein